MAAWFDRWLRDGGTDGHRDGVELFVRQPARPEPDLEDHPGRWIRDDWPSAHSRTDTRELSGPRSLAVEPDTGVAAWIDCAGHLPWGLSGDQREDDAWSLTWEWDADGEALVGHPRVRVRVSADAPHASLSVKLCDVGPDGTSVLISRGSLDLAYRDGVHGSPRPLEPGEAYDVTVDLDACAYEVPAGRRLRLSVAGADWPNTIAPPAPVTLTVHAGELDLPLWDDPGEPAPTYPPGEPTSSEDASDVSWTVTHDVLRRTTTCAVDHGSTYPIPHGGSSTEHYTGEVGVDRRTFAQHATAGCTYALSWPGVDVRVESTMRVDVTEAGYDVHITVDAYDADQPISSRTWTESIAR
jgi:hypothetical protein